MTNKELLAGLLANLEAEAAESGDETSLATVNALKEALAPKYVLTGTDGFSIDSTVYKTLKEAQENMRKAYDACAPEGLDEDEGESYCGELSACLFGDQTVYCWDITEVK